MAGRGSRNSRHAQTARLAFAAAAPVSVSELKLRIGAAAEAQGVVEQEDN